jgi:predicted enzyme related to lactoylglutathione lyase
MSDRYIPGVPCWADITPPDAEAAVEFYGGLFGWEFENVAPPGAPTPYYIARLRGEDVGAIGSQPEGPPAWNTYIWVEDADETVAKVLAAGGSVVSEPMDVGPAGRTAVIADPAGATLHLWQPNQHRGATIVNEHGGVNFNTLESTDVDGARAFYGAVFGWEVLDTLSMFALPAYGDFLEARTPGMRENMRAMGAPDRFEEVVASVAPIPADQPDTFPHWGVTFAVDDADAIAARADKLGGWVVVPPFDAPWVRMTVISDPQGATFTASKFVPENKDLSTESASAARS